LKSIALTITENSKELLQFLKSSNFSKAILIGIAVTLPIVVGIGLGHFEIGLALCLGAFWSSPSDVSGSYRHQKVWNPVFRSIGYVGELYWRVFKVRDLVSAPYFRDIDLWLLRLFRFMGLGPPSLVFSGLLALVLSFAMIPKNWKFMNMPFW